MKRISLISIICILLSTFTFAQKWEVPENKKEVVSSFKFDENTQKLGAILFEKNCMSCHGEPGKANFAQLKPEPGDIVSEKFSKQKDGELFYKITTGRGLMPSFASVLKEEERWQVISYIRSYHKGYVQVIGKAENESKEKLVLTLEKSGENKIIAKAITSKEKLEMPNVQLKLFVKRYFGNLQIGETTSTNKNGIATFELDKNIAADTLGNITLILKPTNQELYGDAEAQLQLKFGIKNTKEPLNKNRAIWNTVGKAPYWIMFTYIIGLFSVFAVIIYVVLQLLKFKKTSLKN